MRHRTSSSVLATLVALSAIGAQASQIVYDGFNLTFPAYNGGVGFKAPWAQGGFNVFAAGYTAAEPSLFYVNGQGFAGNEGNWQNQNAGKAGLETNGGSIAGGAYPGINGAVRPLTQAAGLDNTTVYFSFLIQPRGTLNAGAFNGFFGFTLNGNLGTELFIGKPGGGALAEYVLEARGGGGQVSSGAPVVIGQTALLVVKAQFLPGRDLFTLYVNPAPGAEPATGTVKTDLDLGSVTALGLYSTGAFAIDEIRMGTTYADVVPAANPVH